MEISAESPFYINKYGCTANSLYLDLKSGNSFHIFTIKQVEVLLNNFVQYTFSHNKYLNNILIEANVKTFIASPHNILGFFIDNIRLDPVANGAKYGKCQPNNEPTTNEPNTNEPTTNELNTNELNTNEPTQSTYACSLDQLDNLKIVHNTFTSGNVCSHICNKKIITKSNLKWAFLTDDNRLFEMGIEYEDFIDTFDTA